MIKCNYIMNNIISHIFPRHCAILVFAFILIVNNTKPQSTVIINANVQISSVDSTKDYYVFQSSDSTRKYKIISRKIPMQKQNIHIGEQYNVTLKSLNDSYPKELQTDNPCDVFFNFGDGNLISNDPESRCEIYYCKEFIGLYYTTDDLEQDEYAKWIEINPIEVKSLRNNHKKSHIYKHRIKKLKRF